MILGSAVCRLAPSLSSQGRAVRAASRDSPFRKALPVSARRGRVDIVYCASASCLCNADGTYVHTGACMAPCLRPCQPATVSRQRRAARPGISHSHSSSYCRAAWPRETARTAKLAAAALPPLLRLDRLSGPVLRHPHCRRLGSGAAPQPSVGARRRAGAARAPGSRAPGAGPPRSSVTVSVRARSAAPLSRREAGSSALRAAPLRTGRPSGRDLECSTCPQAAPTASPARPTPTAPLPRSRWPRASRRHAHSLPKEATQQPQPAPAPSPSRPTCRFRPSRQPRQGSTAIERTPHAIRHAPTAIDRPTSGYVWACGCIVVQEVP